MGSIPGLGRSPGGGNDNPLHYSRLGNLKDRRAWRAAGSQRSRHDLATQGQQRNRFYKWEHHCSFSSCKRSLTLSPTSASSVRYSGRIRMLKMERVYEEKENIHHPSWGKILASCSICPFHIVVTHGPSQQLWQPEADTSNS